MLGLLVAQEESGNRYFALDLVVHRSAIAVDLVVRPPRRCVAVHFIVHGSAERTLLYPEPFSVRLPSPRMHGDLRGGLHVLGKEVLDELRGAVEEVLLGAVTLTSGLLDLLVQCITAGATHLGPEDLIDRLSTGQRLQSLLHLLMNLQMNGSRRKGRQLGET